MLRNVLWFWHWGTVQLLTKHSHICFFSKHAYIWYFNVSNMKVNFPFSWEKTNYCFEWAWYFKMCSAIKNPIRKVGTRWLFLWRACFSNRLFQHVRRLFLKLELSHPATWGTPWGAVSTNTEALVFRNEVCDSSLWKYVFRTRRKDMHVCIRVHAKPRA